MGAFDGKVAVVTGASRGLGLALARRFAAEGARVVLVARSREALEAEAARLTAEGHEALAVPCDVGELAEVEAVRERTLAAFGRLDVWVNDAGVSGPYGPTVSLAPDAFEAVVRTNVLGTYHGSIVALRHFLPRREGTLVNLLGRGDKKPVAFQNAYASSKAWIRSFTLGLAKEHEGEGVGIHLAQPGLVDTDLLRKVDVVEGYEDQLDVFGTIVAMWAQAPERPAGRIVDAVARRGGRAGHETRQMGALRMLAGSAGYLLRRAFGRAAPAAIDVRAQPADWSPERASTEDGEA